MKKKSRESVRKARAKRRRRRIIFSVSLIILLPIAIVVAYFMNKIKGMQDTDFNASNIIVNDEVADDHDTGYTTIALFGLDTDGVGNLESGGRSDSIIIASINNETKEVKLASVYRDTYLNMTDDTYSKANAAYSQGGAEQAISMLNMNLDLTIDKYIAIDYNALIDTVDALGGIDVELTSTEITHMNNYMIDIADATGKSYESLPVADGTYTLSGIQATAYCRVRYTAGDDFKRTERHRVVIEKILEKAKTTDIATLTKIVDSVSDEVNTNLSTTEILSLTKDVTSYNLSETTGFPFTKATPTISGASCVVACGLSYNVSQLHEFLYGDTNYQPSTTVETISDYVENLTGITTEEIEETDTTDTTGSTTTQ